jgi:hypothetical protein
MEEQKNDKRTLSIELDNEVKKVSITGMDKNEQVVMKQELNEEDITEATGGAKNSCIKFQFCARLTK